MPARPRVLPPTTTAGLAVLSIGLGLLFGVLGSWITSWAEDAISPTGGMGTSRYWWIGAIVLASFLIPAWIVGRVIARVHQQVLPILLAAALYGAACVAGIACVVLHLNPDAIIAPLGKPLALAQSVVIVIAIAFYGVIATILIGLAVIAGFLTERFLGRRVIVQPGLICWTCGYNLGSSSISICPECGQHFSPTLPPRNFSLWFLATLKRARHWLFAVAALLALAPLSHTISTHTIPSVRFLSACPPTGELRRVMNVNLVWLPRSGGLTANFARPLTHGWWIPDPLTPDTGISVIFYPVTPEGQPSMFISRGSLNEGGAAAAGFRTPRESWWVYPGTENITARLNLAQSRRIIAAGTVPAPLRDAILAKALDLNWAPQSSSSKWPSVEQKVDAAPFFPPNSNHPQPPTP